MKTYHQTKVGVIFLFLFLSMVLGAQTQVPADILDQVVDFRVSPTGDAAFLHINENLNRHEGFRIRHRSQSYGPYPWRPYFGFLQDGSFWYEALDEDGSFLMIDGESYEIDPGTLSFLEQISDRNYRGTTSLNTDLSFQGKAFIKTEKELLGPFVSLGDSRWSEAEGLSFVFQTDEGYGIRTEKLTIGGTWDSVTLNSDRGEDKLSYLYEDEGLLHLVWQEELIGAYTDLRVKVEGSGYDRTSSLVRRSREGTSLFSNGEFGPFYREIHRNFGRGWSTQAYIGKNQQGYYLHSEEGVFGPFEKFDTAFVYQGEIYRFVEEQDQWYYFGPQGKTGPLDGFTPRYSDTEHSPRSYLDSEGNLLIPVRGEEETTYHLGAKTFGPFPNALRLRHSLIGTDLILASGEKETAHMVYLNGELLLSGKIPYITSRDYESFGENRYLFSPLEGESADEESRDRLIYLQWGDRQIGPLIPEGSYARELPGAGGTPLFRTEEGDYTIDHQSNLVGPYFSILPGSRRVAEDPMQYGYQKDRQWYLVYDTETYGPFPFINQQSMAALSQGVILSADQRGYTIHQEEGNLGPYPGVQALTKLPDGGLFFLYGSAPEFYIHHDGQEIGPLRDPLEDLKATELIQILEGGYYFLAADQGDLKLYFRGQIIDVIDEPRKAQIHQGELYFYSYDSVYVNGQSWEKPAGWSFRSFEVHQGRVELVLEGHYWYNSDLLSRWAFKDGQWHRLSHVDRGYMLYRGESVVAVE